MIFRQLLRSYIGTAVEIMTAHGVTEGTLQSVGSSTLTLKVSPILNGPSGHIAAIPLQAIEVIRIPAK
ncbi:hypothetical protein WJ0W_002593 [Paenibacillus melissococcoides]|uniref:DUF2642 domain-containing protein n=1 Tax=Paenibacillus melissococcoides TaxID=2912268 RepID=A0ABN8U2R6_9BACL|nr:MULTISPECIES: hypothetical protein [Paenibacillus]MEB9893980.1 hypothetical protein [Bacillus cereus]CAH8245358.1 hypothetical protein WJ0W_002593 [Paenibacillus melissococcoides]CAH8710735.1 hypothetical protein WDD9_002673 [Paenibacillus melissococcoides]CAH8711508.1 hypothetical protein HTL2_002974 [Paenibacillus melissococcoides]GIO77818.1 hypothetical protein J6TS7_14280 [Paenibacillus dendritiformis]